MNAAVDGFKENNINALQDVSNRIHDFHAGIPDSCREFMQAITAFRDAAAASKTGDNTTH
ncbi:MAG: hypothetical protein Fues2KO_30400 [Fuerstiella sp.]